MKTKQEIRRECRQRRTEQSVRVCEESSRKICQWILDSEEYRKREVVLAYIATQGEVDLQILLMQALQSGKKVGLPRVQGETMEFFWIQSLDDLAEGYFHIQEPKESCLPVGHHEPALFLIPGVAYDRQGHRIGYGGGFYDRYLSSHRGDLTVGIGFDFQIYPSIPYEALDCPVEHLLTETGWIR